MLTIDRRDFSETVGLANKKIQKLRPKPIMFFDYIKRVLRDEYKTSAPQYPMEIKIPKSMEALMKGDLEPGQVIHIDKPITMDDGTPMWFAESCNQSYLRFGYTNLDAREVCNLALSSELIHGFLGGASGHGKSVTINGMIAGLCYEYAPWEVELHMSDAKIVEFKKYGIGKHIPHIRTIAATEDADYVVSVLQEAFNQMTYRNKVFGALGVSNLTSFKKRTGLTLPRVIIVMDEVESTFRMAGKKATKIGELIDGFARLGRSAGYHVVMATQNMSSDIPKSALGQIGLRMCLGCTAQVSEAVLGNNGARDNYGRIGKMIANPQALASDSKLNNILYQTPFLTDDNFVEEMDFLEKKGRDVGWRAHMAFYDEEKKFTPSEWDSMVETAFTRMNSSGENPANQTTICLGEPSFVCHDSDNMLKVKLNSSDIENIILLSTSNEATSAMLHNLHVSVKQTCKEMHYYTAEQFNEAMPDVLSAQEVRDASKPPLTFLSAIIGKRLLLLEIDKMLDQVTYDAAAIEEILKEQDVPKELWGNDITYKRAAAYSVITTNPMYSEIWQPLAPFIQGFGQIISEFQRYKCAITPITRYDFDRVAIYLGSLASIIGYGRDSKTKLVNELKKCLQDGYLVNIFFIVYTRSLEGLSDLVSAVRYAIFDLPDSKDWGKMRTDAPTALKPNLAVLYDTLDAIEPQKKFKKLDYEEGFLA